MKGMLIGAVLLVASSFSPANAVTPMSDELAMVVGMEYTQQCVEEGYVIASNDDGKKVLDLIYMITKSRLYYDRLSFEDKQTYADALWEMQNQYTYREGCKIMVEEMISNEPTLKGTLSYLDKKDI